MTASVTSPGPLYFLLSLYAALDKAVITSDDDGVSEIVERFLPGTAGENAGWSTSLEELVGPMAPLNEALEGLANGPDLTFPELSRLVYIVGAIIHVPGLLEENVGRVTDVLTLAGPDRVRDAARADRFRVWLAEELQGWQDWPKVQGFPVEAGFLDARIAKVPLCNAYLGQYRGRECVIIDTRFEDEELTPQKVKDVVDMLNWDTIGGRFFVDMTPLKPPRLDGWTRVLETADLTGGVPFPYTHKTNLKYIKIDEGQYAGRLLYELDDFAPFPGAGDGAITIDHGYINIRALHPGAAKPGCRVVTKKVVRVEEFPPILQKIWICALGYGHQAEEMIFGGAQDDTKGLSKWADPPDPVAPIPPLPPQDGQQGGTDTTAPGTGSAAKPYPPKTAGSLAVTMLSECLEDVSKDSAALASKWAKGQLQVSDMAQFSSKFGARLMSDAWIFFEKLNKLPPPPGGTP